VAYAISMSVLPPHFRDEKENNSVGEVSRLLISIHDILVELQAQKFMSVEVRNLIEEKRREGLGACCDKFCVEVNCFYENCTEYPKKWKLRMWMELNLHTTVRQCKISAEVSHKRVYFH